MIRVLASNEKFLGKTHGEWGAEWMNWLCSNDPDNVHSDDPIVFLRANIDYDGYGDSRKQIGSHFENNLTIKRDSVAVFFPLLEAQFYIGHPYYYEPPYPPNEKERERKVETDKEIFYLLEKDLKDARDMKGTINGIEVSSVRARSTVFTLTVTEKN